MVIMLPTRGYRKPAPTEALMSRMGRVKPLGAPEGTLQVTATAQRLNADRASNSSTAAREHMQTARAAEALMSRMGRVKPLGAPAGAQPRTSSSTRVQAMGMSISSVHAHCAVTSSVNRLGTNIYVQVFD